MFRLSVVSAEQSRLCCSRWASELERASGHDFLSFLRVRQQRLMVSALVCSLVCSSIAFDRSRALALPPLPHSVMSAAVSSPVFHASPAPSSDYLFWSQFETELLWAWLCAYEKTVPAAALRSDRETLLQLLVERRWSKKLKSGQEFAHLRMVWIQITDPPVGSFVPGLYLDQPEDRVQAGGSWTAQPLSAQPLSAQPLPRSSNAIAAAAAVESAPAAAAAPAAAPVTSTSTAPAPDPLAFPCPHCHRTLHVPHEMQQKHAKACQKRADKGKAK